MTKSRHLDECSALLTATSSSSSISIDEDDMLLVQPTTSSSSYRSNVQARWTFFTSSSSRYGVFIELLELDSERTFDTLQIVGRAYGSSSSSTVSMSGTTTSFTNRLYTSGVYLSWRTDGSISSGVGFRVRVTRAVIPGGFSRSSSLSGNIMLREYATTVHNSGTFTKSLEVPSGREVALQATTTTAYIGGMNVAWVLAPPLASQTLKVDILNMDMRSADSVTFSSGSWSTTPPSDGFAPLHTFYVRGPLTVRVMTIAGNYAGTFDIRVVATNTQPTVGSGAQAAPNTCGGSGSLPAPVDPDSGGGTSGGGTSGGGTSGGSSSTDVDSGIGSSIGAVVGTIFPIIIALSVASIAYRYYKRRQMTQRAAAAAATANANNNSGGNNNTGVQLNAASFAMGTAAASPRAPAPAPAPSSSNPAANNASPYPGTTSASPYGAPPSSPGGYPGPGSAPSAYPPAGGGAPPQPYAPAYPAADASSGNNMAPTYGAYPGMSPGMATSVAPYSTGGAYPPAGSAPPAYGSAPPAYGSAPPAYGSAPGAPPGSSAYPGSTPGSSAYPGM